MSKLTNMGALQRGPGGAMAHLKLCMVGLATMHLAPPIIGLLYMFVSKITLKGKYS